MKKTVLITLIVILSFTAVSCASAISGSYGEPINVLAEAVKSGDADKYLSVFEEKYISELEEYFTIISDVDLETTVSETLASTKAYNKESCGAFTSVSVTEVKKETLGEFPSDAVYTGTFEPDGEVGEILSLTVSYVIEGMSSSTDPKEATFIVYSVNGEYYLHPMHMMFVFQ